MLERVSPRRTGDSRRISSEPRSSPRRDGPRRVQVGSVDSERRASIPFPRGHEHAGKFDRRMGRLVRSEMDRRVGDRRVMAERRITASA